jgi:hypothetical protein
MKNKIIFMMLLTLAYVKSYSQEYVIEHCVEDRTFKSQSGLICSNEERNKWFAIQIIYKTNTNYPIVDGLKIIKTNIGDYNRVGDLMVFTFTDRTTIKIKARTSLLEDLNIEFDLTNKDLDALLNKTIISIRYINGTDYKSYTYYTKDVENIFFLNALKFYRLKRINCE